MTSPLTPGPIASLADLDAILEGIGEAFLAFDGQWNLTYLNSKARELIARLRPGVELLGKNIWQEFPQARDSQTYAELQRVMRTGIPAYFSHYYAALDACVEVHAYPGTAGGVNLHVVDITSRKRAEDALRESEERFRAMADAAPMMIWMSGPDKGLSYVNPAWLQLTGRTLEEERGTGWLRRLHPDDMHRCWQAYSQAFDSRASFEIEYRMRNVAGQYRWLLDRGTPRFHPSGEFVGFIGCAIDITDRRLSVDELRASRQRFAGILEIADDAIISVDEQQNITLFNRGAEKIFGYRAEELIGQSLDVLLPERFLKIHRDHVSHYAHSGEGTRRMAPFREIYGKRKDGSEFPAEASISRLALNGQKVFTVMLRDVTSRRQAEENLRRSEERYREIFEYALTGNFVALPDGTLLDCNQAFLDAFGFESRERALGQSLQRFWPVEQPFAELVEVLRINRTLKSHESELRDAHDQPLHVIANYAGRFDEAGNLTEIRGYIFNDTHRKNLEEQLRQSQKMDAVGRLAGGVAHDFNNLLTVITGHSELLIERLGPHDISRRSAEQIQKAARRAAGLTHQLLAFSRKQILAPQVLDLNVVVDHVAKMLRRVLGEDIELRLRLNRELGHIKADPVQVEQMIMNLAINARDAMPGGGRITIETQNAELDEEYARQHVDVKPGAYVMLAVSDTGEGMSAETQARIFEPFFTTKDIGKGTGLGLSTVYGIVRQSSGSIWVYSEPGHGSTFKVYLPQVAEEEEVAVIGAEKILSMPSDGWETVLLVEDEEGVRLLGKKLLEMLGYNVLAASHGAEALDIARQYDRDIHLLLTDVVMPGMSGRDLARRLVRIRPKTRVLYMSGYTGDTVVRHGVRSGESMFLQKPFNKEALAEKVREALDAENAKPRRRSARA